MDELARICEREHPRLVGLLTLRTGDRGVAEELAQDALVELCRVWPAVDRPDRWLTTVALNRSRSWWRRRAAERRALARHGAVDEAVPARPVADGVALIDAVAALPRRQQEALLLPFHAGYSVAETAAHLGCAEGTVTSLTARAREALRNAGIRLHEEETYV